MQGHSEEDSDSDEEQEKQPIPERLGLQQIQQPAIVHANNTDMSK